MAKNISLGSEEREKLKKDFPEVSRMSIYRALSGVRNTPLLEDIRARAIDIKKETLKEVEND